MNRWIVCFLILSMAVAQGEVARSKRAGRPKLKPASAQKAEPAKPQEPAQHASKPVETTTSSKPKPQEVPPQAEGVQMRWYGHAFVYLISKNGVRVAVDPFGEEVGIPFPARLQADVVLVSNESMAHAVAERLYGAPQTFRSVTAVGANQARGILFTGVESFQHQTMGKASGRNTIFVFELDGIRFCHLGNLGTTLSRYQREQIEEVDVLFLPVGNESLSVEKWMRIADQLEAKWVIPVAYQNVEADLRNFRPLEDFVKEWEKTKPLRRIQTSGFIFNQLPDKPTLLLLSPSS